MAKATWQRKGPTARPMWDRFWEKVEVGDGCWNWTARLDRNGYGNWTNREGRTQTTRNSHRVAYEMLVGPIPPGLTLDHLCRNRRCVNPTHLEPVSHRENILRSPSAVSAVNARKTACPRGHPFDEANTYVTPDGARQCRTCNRANAARYAKGNPNERHTA